MSISRQESQQQDEIGLLELSTDLQKEIIAEVCDEPATLLPLRRINKSIRDTIDGSSLFRFYKSNYSYHAMTSQLGYYILNKNKITAEDFRLGNQMVIEGVNLYLEGSFNEAESLFINAMCKHGSSHAMVVIFELSKLPGRIKLSSLEELQKLHNQRENSVLAEMVKNHFTLGQRKNCVSLINLSQIALHDKCINFCQAIYTLWMEDNGISLNNIDKLNDYFRAIFDKIVEYREDTLESELPDYDAVNEQFTEYFDAMGLFGMQEPHDSAWYLSPVQKLSSPSLNSKNDD